MSQRCTGDIEGHAIGARCVSDNAPPFKNKPSERKTNMSKIKNKRQFKEGIDSAFEGFGAVPRFSTSPPLHG